MKPLIFAHSRPQRQNRHQAPATADVATTAPDAERLRPFLRQQPPPLPEVSELDVVRHFTRLSQRNFSVDTHFYPLGSCTMKYNPRVCHTAAMQPGF